MDLGEFYRGKRVLITGHTGFKGGWLALWLHELGAEVAGLSLPAPADWPGIFRAAGIDRLIAHHEGDIRDLAAVNRVFAEHEPEIVFHLAAQALVRNSYHDPLATYATNVLGTAHVLEAARRCNSTRAVVNVTTDKCYENHEKRGGYREEDRLGGYDPYSSSKACSELVTAAYRDSFFTSRGGGLATARAGNVVGGGDWCDDRLVPDFLRALMREEPIRIRRPSAVRPWQFVLEPLSGYMLLAAKLWHDPAAYSSAWNFGPAAASHTTVLELAQRLVAEFGRGTIEVNEDDSLHETGYLALDCSKARERLGWESVLSFDETIAWTAEWYAALLRDPDKVAELSRQQIHRYQKLHSPSVGKRAVRGTARVMPCRTALVTGATGFIGEHLVRRLVGEGVTTYCLVRAQSLTPQVRQRLAGAQCLPLDADTPEDWAAALRDVRAEAVFHLASAGVSGAESPQTTIDTNVRMISGLLSAAAGWPLQNIVLAGSFSEYGDSPELLTEDSPLVPCTPYGASKAAAWLCGRALAQQLGLPLVHLRLFHVYGPGESERRLIPSLYSRLSNRQPAALTGGNQARDMVYVSDVVEAFLAAAALPPADNPAAYNVCTSEAVTIRQVGQLVARQLNVPEALLRWGELPYRLGEPMFAIGDNRRFQQATGWQPQVGLADGIDNTLTSCGWRASLRLTG
jgi:CDP-glucose 4,6-dehydratase